MGDNRDSVFPEETNYVVRSAALWGKILAILGFVAAGLILVATLCVGIFAALGNDICHTVSHPGLLVGVYAIAAAIVFIPNYFLYRSSVKMEKCIALGDINLMNRAYEGLKTYFILNAILSLIGLLAMFVGVFAVFFMIV